MKLNNVWSEFLKSELEKEYYTKLNEFVELEYKSKTIYPKYENIFRAFNLLLPSEVKVVIIGQDPYHGAKQANGLAFSVSPLSKVPPSLKNIYKELIDDMNCETPANGDLTSWAKQGVLLINTVLTVIEAEANSHRGKGWEILTDSIIKKLSDQYKNIVFVLWGSASHKKVELIDSEKHLVLKSVHPSPLSAYRGFFGSKPFSQTNDYLKMKGKTAISWCLTPQQTLL
ncbi:MAG: uracil-DNA glycosylase [Campylobacterota bacterium]|nr:uracil-DNA glycosylase [Campylobacterota bacterium]